MLNDLIPNYAREVGLLHDLAPTGWIMCFNLTYTGPEHLYNAYPEEWRHIYEVRNYFYSDPVARWTIMEEGATRWSAIPRTPLDMPFWHEAQKFKLNYGLVVSLKSDAKRSFLTLSHPSREFTDIEIAEVSTRFHHWVDLVLNRASLTAGELDVLRCLAEGLGQQEIAAQLNIAEPTVKQRAQKAQAKLGAKSRAQAVAIAVSRNYL